MSNKRIRKKQSQNWGNCPLCGKPLPKEPGKSVVGSSGRAVCTRCLETAWRLAVRPKEETLSRFLPDIRTPAQIVTELDRSIIGQDEAKWAVAAALWKQQLRARGLELPGASLLLYGPTGCGKTALVRRAADAVCLPFLHFDATTLSENGYRGRDAADMVSDLIQRSGSKDRARHGVIFLDEVDKLAAHAGNAHRADYCRGTQYSLLRLIEGAVVNIPGGDTMSTSGILFLFGGAFTGLNSRESDDFFRRHMGFERDATPQAQATTAPTSEDFVSFGMERELMGRIGRCVPLQGLTADDLRRILTESDQSVFRAYQDFFRSKGQELTLDNDAAKTLVDKALARGMGARGLNALVEEWVQPRLLELAEANHERE